ncbi:pyridoxine 5'-phosphate synthase [Iodidimonas gelatinilytica]|uniref:Pyridoxine 5'-phosphate synthase n=1 Tax=Iodidimonas gelatinilytica TaxID=1236966 RepID=A0A5A7N2R1_9PROT|nr:pyridoxine 5'-phosphate synthase [Iodidimonas gelatinilytica]GER01356.1 pyridoxine 5'-phosphate synthase [Iodidimonas gelatinilytica]
MKHLRLGVNIDHVATVRNARGSSHPDPVRAAMLAAACGADQITAHLREDRRHITDRDIERLMMESPAPLNMEMATTRDMLAIALRHKPFAICIVPERREELTTEGGLDAVAGFDALVPIVGALADAGCRVSLFLDASKRQLDAAHRLGAHAVELHTGAYANAMGAEQLAILDGLKSAAKHGAALGLEMHAGHGLTYDNVTPVAAIAEIEELNIGHYLIGEAIFVGLEASLGRMRTLMDQARRQTKMVQSGAAS